MICKIESLSAFSFGCGVNSNMSPSDQEEATLLALKLNEENENKRNAAEEQYCLDNGLLTMREKYQLGLDDLDRLAEYCGIDLSIPMDNEDIEADLSSLSNSSCFSGSLLVNKINRNK